MMPLLWTLFSIAAALAPLSLPAAPPDLSSLVPQADAIAVVEIVSTDYAATAADGPMYVEANVLRAIKGKAVAGQRVRFGASAWVGPTFKTGEHRVIFLEALPAGHSYYRKARWASLEAGKIDLFIADEAIERCTAKALSDFLKGQKGGPPPRKAQFQ